MQFESCLSRISQNDTLCVIENVSNKYNCAPPRPSTKVHSNLLFSSDNLNCFVLKEIIVIDYFFNYCTFPSFLVLREKKCLKSNKIKLKNNLLTTEYFQRLISMNLPQWPLDEGITRICQLIESLNEIFFFVTFLLI